MNNYINIDKISASLMTAVYLIILASIATIINTSNSIVYMIFYRACEKKSVNSGNLSFL